MSGNAPNDAYFEAVMVLFRACRGDDRLHRSLHRDARHRIVSEHSKRVATEYGLNHKVLALLLAQMMERSDNGVEFAKRRIAEIKARMAALPADGPPGERYGLTDVERGAEGSTVDGAYVEVFVARVGTPEKPWAVLSYFDCDSSVEMQGVSGREDFTTLEDASEAFDGLLDRHPLVTEAPRLGRRP